MGKITEIDTSQNSTLHLSTDVKNWIMPAEQ